jgi:hypothetical protein
MAPRKPYVPTRRTALSYYDDSDWEPETQEEPLMKSKSLIVTRKSSPSPPVPSMVLSSMRLYRLGTNCA